jgi:hypothetical protein
MKIAVIKKKWYYFYMIVDTPFPSDLFPETLPYPTSGAPVVAGISQKMQIEVSRIMPTTPFINLRELGKTSMRFDIKYASRDNFANREFYKKDSAILLRREVAL